MTSVPVTEATGERTPTLADIDADTGKNPDPTGDYAAGRFRFHASTEDLLAHLNSLPYKSDDD